MAQSTTSVANTHFDLVSVLYHSLRASQTCDQYIRDAQGDQELVQFFQQIKKQDDQCAQQAMKLLTSRAGH